MAATATTQSLPPWLCIAVWMALGSSMVFLLVFLILLIFTQC
jgi:hypothetical protein